MVVMILADKIIQLRKQFGWSQENLADALNVSRQSVSKWESGNSIPDLTKILKMAEIFGVSTDYLLKDEIEKPDATGTDEEKLILTEVVKMLSNTKIYEISKVKHLISKINPAQSANIELWIINVKKAILTGNQQRFEQLLAIAK